MMKSCVLGYPKGLLPQVIPQSYTMMFLHIFSTKLDFLHC